MRCNRRLLASLLLVIAVTLLANRYYNRNDEMLQQLLKVVRQPKTKSLNGRSNALQSSGYVLTLEFTGQLVAGLRGIMSMQCWLASFGLSMSIVEPFVINSKLVNGISAWRAQDEETTKPLIFTDYFNTSMFNHASERNGRPLLTSWERFWGNAPRKLIVVTVRNPFVKDCLSYTKAEMCKGEGGSDLEGNRYSKEQFLSGCEPSENATNSIGYLKERGFKVVRTVCLNCNSRTSHYSTPTEVTYHIFGDYNPSEVTLLINLWKFSFEMTPNCTRCNKRPATVEGNPLALFSPSPQLLRHADVYIKSLRMNPNTRLVAVMIRIEWFLIMHRRSSLETVRECLSKVLKEYNKYLSAHPLTRTVLALDIGKYGSGTFNSTLKKNNITQEYFAEVIEAIEGFVKEVDLDYTQWEGSFEAVIGGGYDRGYIALLQSVIVSKADYVIRMGGGHYQQLAIQLFLKNRGYTQQSTSDQSQVIDVCARRRVQ